MPRPQGPCWSYCGDCCNSSCLTSEDFFKDQALYSSKDGHVWKKREPCIEPFLLLTSKSVFGPSSGSKQKQWVLCEWEAQAPQLCVIDFSKPESSEVAVHMESNCDSRLYRHSHNPLPILQQTPWQTGGTEADNPLSKQVHVAVIAHCSPSVSDWFCSQVSWWTEPEGYSPNQQ